MRLFKKEFSYGWIVVFVCTILFFNHGTILYSYSVFFKPLEDTFKWSRSTVSLAYSLEFIFLGIFQIFSGWCVDKFGPRKVLFVSSFITGLALFLTSKISEPWQLYITYGLILSLGISAINVICTVTTARWFSKRRGLALGIVSAGIGLGTSIGIPIISELINSPVGWSRAYIYLALFALVMIFGAVFLRLPAIKRSGTAIIRFNPSCLLSSSNKRSLFMIIGIYFLFNLCVQTMMVHLVNYGIDLGIAPVAAAFLMTLVGLFSIGGRMAMGLASDRFGVVQMVFISCSIVTVALLLIIVSHSLVMLYIVAIIFGIGYGGVVPEITPMVGIFYGYENISFIVGMVFGIGNLGGALGAWLAGYIFDISKSYEIAFAVAAVSALTAVLLSRALVGRSAVKAFTG